jgi:hypothetical protein
MVSRFGLLFTIVASGLFACAGVVLAQPTGSQQAAEEEFLTDASSLEAGDVIPDRYIVVLKDDDSPDPAVAADALAETLDSDLKVIHTYKNALKGFSVRVPSGLDLPAALSADPRVDFIAQDRVIKASAQYMPTGVNRIEAG